MKLCKAFGLDVANVEIVDFAGTKALAVERFDRIWTRDGRLLRRPQEDMCRRYQYRLTSNTKLMAVLIIRPSCNCSREATNHKMISLPI